MSGLNIRDVTTPIEAAIKKAAAKTGVDFDFLLRTARRESSLNPHAKAKTSSAAGLFQFVEQTWLGMLKQHGAKHGYGIYSQMIERGRDGRLRIPDEDARRAVMDLRFDASCSSLMAGELASDHASYLKGRIGRDATAGELYAAHFLGPNGAAKLIEAQDRQPGGTAANLFPKAAAANKSIFYRQGRACTVDEVYERLTGGAGNAGAAAPAKPSKAPARVAAVSPDASDSPPQKSAAYAAYSLNERLDRMRQERSMVDDVLFRRGRTGMGVPLSSDLLSLLAAARDDEKG
jgi:hypothetical protein